MTDPKRTIERLSKYAKNGDFARHSEMMEQTDALQNMAENVKPISHIGSFVQHFLDEVTPKRGRDYLPDEEMAEIKKELTPVYKKDYLTDEEVAKIKEDITPKKGVHYDDGHTPTPEELIALITPLIPEPVPGEPGRNGFDADEERIIKSVLSKIPAPKDGKNPSVKEVVKATLAHLGSLKGNDRPSLKMFREADDLIGSVALHKNMLHNMPKSLIDGDQRWHGGFPGLVAGTGVTLTTNANGTITVTSSGSGGIWVTGNNTTPTPGVIGTQDGVNLTFTLPSTPVSVLFLYLNGQLLTDLGVDYTLTGATILMVIAPLSTDTLTWRFQ